MPARDLETGEAPYWISKDFYLKILDLIAEGQSARYPVEITFDDGNASDAEIGAPGLNERGLPATFFALSGRLDQPGSLSQQQIKTLIAQGHKIGLHGMDHVDWTGLDEAGFDRELVCARALLEAACDQKILEAAIPFGRFNRNVLSHLRQQGFTRVYSSDGGITRAGDWPSPRLSVQSGHSLEDVKTILTGGPSGAKAYIQRVKSFIKSRV